MLVMSPLTVVLSALSPVTAMLLNNWNARAVGDMVPIGPGAGAFRFRGSVGKDVIGSPLLPTIERRTVVAGRRNSFRTRSTT